MAGSPPILDHATILVSQHFLKQPPTWAAQAFTLTPGGRSGDGLTESKLTLFEDGTYLEFVAFADGVESKARSRHRYALCMEGSIVDWAIRRPLDDMGNVAGSREAELEDARRRLRGSGVGALYTDPVEVCTQMADGSSRRQRVAYPSHDTHQGRGLELRPGEVPVWVLEQLGGEIKSTPGQEDHNHTKHACGATGLSSIEVYVRTGPGRTGSWNEGRAKSLREIYQTLFGYEPREDVDEGKSILEWIFSGSRRGLAAPRVRLVGCDDMGESLEVRVGLLGKEGTNTSIEIVSSEHMLDMRLDAQATEAWNDDSERNKNWGNFREVWIT